MFRTERILCLLSILALLLNLFTIPFGGFLTVLVLSSLSMLYFGLGFAVFNEVRFRSIFKSGAFSAIKKIRIVGAACTGLALSLTLIGLLFKFQSWPMANLYLMVGLIPLGIIAIIALSRYIKGKSPYYTKIFSRITLFGTIALIVLLLPPGNFIDFKYRNHPAYRDALKNAVSYPTNKEYQDKLEEERNKMRDKQIEQLNREEPAE